MPSYSNVLLGPWGGEDGVQWTYHPTSGSVISRILVTSDDAVIYSISFVTRDQNGNIERSPIFGTPAGTPNEINIDPNEKIILMEGIIGTYNSKEAVTQLSFRTSKKGNPTKQRTFGSMQKGTEFSCPLSYDDPIAGFHGRSGQFLNSIGVSVVAKSREVLPSWGGSSGGSPWSYSTAGRITHISISYSDVIRAIRFKSLEAHGCLDRSEKFGDDSDSKCKYHEIDFNPKTGNLNGIMGTYGTYNGSTVVTSLSFTTSNYRTYGPFGTKIGTHFSHKVTDGNVICGFHGRAGSLIDAIGLYIRSTDLSKNALFVGPIGSEGGIKWEYRPKGLISRILINHTSRKIYAVSFESKDEHGNVDRSPVYGKEYIHGTNFEIDIDSEVGKLNGITGTIDDLYDKDPVIGTLSFSTDKKIVFGPFGNPNKGTHFSIPLKNGFISGFHCASVANNHLYFHSIGVYVSL